MPTGTTSSDGSAVPTILSRAPSASPARVATLDPPVSTDLLHQRSLAPAGHVTALQNRHPSGQLIQVVESWFRREPVRRYGGGIIDDCLRRVPDHTRTLKRSRRGFQTCFRDADEPINGADIDKNQCKIAPRVQICRSRIAEVSWLSSYQRHLVRTSASFQGFA